MPQRRRVPIQVYLAALFAVVTLLIGLSTAGLFYNRMKAASLNSARVSFERLSSTLIEGFIRTRLQIAYRLAVATAGPLATAQTFDERFSARFELLPILRSSQRVVAAYVGYPDGEFLMLRQVENVDRAPAAIRSRTVYVLRSMHRTAHGMRGRFWFYDARFKELAADDEPRYRFDPRIRPWFGATASRGFFTTQPYIFYSNHHLGVTNAERARSGAVFGADIDIANVSDLLASLLPTTTAQAAVLGSDAAVLAFSDRHKLESLYASTGGIPATIYDLGSPVLKAAYDTAKATQSPQTDGIFRDDQNRVWLFHGSRDLRTPALLLVAVPEDDLIADALRTRNDTAMICVGLVIAIVPATFLLSRVVSRPLGELRSDAVALRNMDFTERPSRDSFISEIGEFSDTFSAMRHHISEHNHAATRFIPREFLQQLGRDDIKGLQLGDHAEGTMAILFSDIRSFTTLSGGMTPEQTFKFVNSYLTRIGPIIREYKGFIDKYIGDAIMALFPDQAGNAVDAAVSMQRRVVVYNQERARAGYKPVAIGIGVHYGELMLGTIGETLRFETTVISDAVNIASRLESLTKTFGVLILASGDVMHVADSSLYCARRLGDVQVKGATHPVTLYEICDADPPDLLAHKMQTRDAFDIARVAYAHGDFTEAYRGFTHIARANKDDHPAAYYRDRAAVMASAAHNADWDGVEHMETK